MKNTLLTRLLNTTRLVPLLVGALAFAGASTSQAAVITWSTLVVDSTDTAGAGSGLGDLAVSTNGTLIEAVNYGTQTDVTVNGVTFDGVSIDNAESPANYSNSFDEDAPNSITGTSTGGIIDTLTSTFSRTTSAATTGTLTGLTFGRDYEVQLIASFATIGRTTTFNDGNGNTLATSTNNPHAFAVGIFTADATGTQTLNFPISTGSSFLNAYQLRDVTPVPEPSSLALLFLFSSSFLFTARRRR